MNQLDFDPASSDAKEKAGIDFKRIGYRALKYWYVILISVIVAWTIAFFNNRYAPRIYPVTASIIIRETEETGGGEFLYKNALIDPYRNYLNELYIIRSYPLIQSVIEELNFGMVFYREGNFMTTEAYDYLPVSAKLLKKNGSYGASLIFKILSEESYSLEKFGQEKNSDPQTFRFNDSIDYQGHHLLFTRNAGGSIKSYLGIPFLLTVLDPYQVTGSYVGKLNVKWAEEGASVVNMSVSGPNPVKDIHFLNGLISRYQQYDLDKKNQAAERSIEFIKGQLSRISDSLRIFERQLEQFKNKNILTNLGDEAKRLYEKVELLEIQKAELLVKENYYKYLDQYIVKSANLDQIILPSSIGVNDNVLSSLVNRMVDLQLELKLFIGKEKIDNPIVVSKMARIGEIKKDILESVNTLRSTDKIKLDYLAKQIHDVEREIGYLPMAERQLVSIQRNYSLMENLYVFLMQKMSEAGISKASNTSDIVVINPPMQGGAISPKTDQNFMIAFMLGLLFPFIFFVLLELVNTKIQSKEDIEKITTIPFMGGVGHNRSGDNLAVSMKPKSSVAESFRSLRSNLNFFTGNEHKKIFVISSSISGEGKTFTTINLATVFAMSGRKTLIIGADMRKPKIFTDFNLNNSLGLSGYLSRINTFAEVVQKTSVENLDLISGGPVPPNPSELLLTDRFEQFIKESLAIYDYVLIDTPPLALVTDAFVISKYADHMVFVVRQNYTPKSFLTSIDEYYKTGKLKRVSILLNDIYKSGLGYGYGVGYGYNYGYSYGYGSRKKGQGYYEED